MNFRALTLGAVIGFLVAISPSCGGETPAPCSPANCNGCCAADGACVQPDAVNPDACGKAGGECAVCQSSQTCSAGECVGGQVQQDAGQDGGNPCGTRCPLSDGTCGAAICTDGCCEPGTGQCKGGTTHTACGDGTTSAAVQCVDCTATGDTCVLKGGSPSCGATTMSDGGDCGTRCKLPTGACGEVCTNGCCSGMGNCRPGTSNQQCGNGSSAASVRCVDCTVSGNVCDPTAQTCVMPSPLGRACADSTECADLGPNAVCKLQTSDGSFPYPNGYCTLDCGADPGVCPADAVCAPFADSPLLGETQSLCLKACTATSECRTRDYICLPLGAADELACWIDPPASAGLPGKPCEDSSDCSPPPPWTVGCISDTLLDGGPSGWEDGYCTSACNPTAHPQRSFDCGPTGTCVTLGPNNSNCFQKCASPGSGQSDCRDDYACYSSFGQGVCAPSCEQPGWDCSGAQKDAGYTCQSSGYCCGTRSDGGTVCSTQLQL